MANKEHLAILKQGAEVWNKWRVENAGIIRPDLNGAPLAEADLFRADLRGADLRRALLERTLLGKADLFGADLREAHLGRADLVRADLFGADLTEADLEGADLRRADLGGAGLGGANLRGADLRQAILGEADLEGADLGGAQIGWTTFGEVDLSTVLGLDTVVHWGPSTIGIDTIYRSKGNIPESFLERAGVPHSFIQYMRSLAGPVITFDSCFISYSEKDRPFAEQLYANLRQKEVRCWFAPEDMKIGDKFRTRIDEAIHLQDRLLLILSGDSIKSPWVEKEVETAFEKEKKEGRLVLFPVRLDEAVMESETGWAADIRRSRHIGDFTQWKDHDSYQTGLERLLRDLKDKKKDE